MFDSEDVPESLDYLWQVVQLGEREFAELWSLPSAAAVAQRIESLPLNTLRAVALAQVKHTHTVRDPHYATAWEAEHSDVRHWLDSE